MIVKKVSELVLEYNGVRVYRSADNVSQREEGHHASGVASWVVSKLHGVRYTEDGSGNSGNTTFMAMGLHMEDVIFSQFTDNRKVARGIRLKAYVSKYKGSDIEIHCSPDGLSTCNGTATLYECKITSVLGPLVPQTIRPVKSIVLWQEWLEERHYWLCQIKTYLIALRCHGYRAYDVILFVMNIRGHKNGAPIPVLNKLELRFTKQDIDEYYTFLCNNVSGIKAQVAQE